MAGQATWESATPWRQGHVLSAEALAILKLDVPKDGEPVCVVISHDCDLANADPAVEPSVEVIVGRVLPAADGNYTWAKAPRTLHISIERSGAPLVVELVATQKQYVPKSAFAEFGPDAAFAMDAKGLAVLRNWLAVRYNRAAFPDTFVRRMSTTKVGEKLAKTLAPHGDLISFTYFDLDGGQMIERVDGDPYELSIVLVYPPGHSPDAAANAADKVVDAVQAMCDTRLKGNKDIHLKACFALSEDDLTVSRARVLTQWRLEHMTLKADSPQLGAPP